MLIEDSTNNYIPQITRLLCDRERDNSPLVLDLLSGLGVSNTQLLGYVFGIAVFHPDREISQRAMKLLERYASGQTHQKALRLRETSAYFYEEAEFLSRYKSEEIDLFHLLLASKMCLWHRYRPEPDSNAEVAFRSLDLRRLPCEHLPPSLTVLNFLTFLALPAHRRFDLESALPLLAQMLQLETIIVENIRIERFPVALFSLPRLKALILRKGNFRPRGPMLVPEGGPYGCASLERLVCEGYPIVGAERLGPFPRLREATLPRCSLTTLDFLSQSQYLEHLNVRYNHLESLPTFLADLTALRTLDASQNPLRSLMLDLTRLQQLEVLDVVIRRYV